VDILISEEDDTTRARAVLSTEAGAGLQGSGAARKHPADSNVPEIGDELAAARALSALAHQLLEAAAGDIEAIER
jgi:hypothetical protein